MDSPEIHDTILTPTVQHIVEESERFENVSPVLSFVVKTLVQHLDNLHKIVSRQTVGRDKEDLSALPLPPWLII